MKTLIRLTEEDLHRIVKESVNKILSEYNVGGVSLHGYHPGSNGNFETARDFQTLNRVASQTPSHAGQAAAAQAQDSMDKHLKQHGLDDKSIMAGSSSSMNDKFAKRKNEYEQLNNAANGQYNKIAGTYGMPKV